MTENISVTIKSGYLGCHGEVTASKEVLMPSVVIERLPSIALVIDGVKIPSNRMQLTWDADHAGLIIDAKPFDDTRIAGTEAKDVAQWFETHGWDVTHQELTGVHSA